MRGILLQRVQQPAAPAWIAYSEQVPASCGDVERAQLRIPKGAVRRPIHRDRVRLEHAARWGKDIDHGARSGLAPPGAGDNVPLRVQTHTIDAPLDPPGVLSEGMQYCIGSKRVVVSERIGP